MPVRLMIQTCRDHHAVLRGLVERITVQGSVDPAASASTLGNLRTVLLRHLALEDDRLYPQLTESPDPSLTAKARRYEEEMSPLRAAFVGFYETWGNAKSIAADGPGFVAAWTHVRDALVARMDAEDHDLYELAEDYFNQRARTSPLDLLD